MNPAKTLIRIMHGSHLYGTNTASSDTDIKGVHLPAGEDIVLMRPEHVIDQRIKLSEGLKNTSIDTDDQSYSLQKFLAMLVNGDTVASEIIFAPEASIIEMDPVWPAIREHAKMALNRRCEGYVSYCQRQAAKYGVKGGRMSTIEALINLLKEGYPEFLEASSARLRDIEGPLRNFCEQHEYAQFTEIDVKGVLVPHLDVLDRKFPMTVRIQEAFKIYERVYLNYGQRAIAAKNNEGIDWKAVSHAIRVAGQAIELLTTHEIVFPRYDADYLLEVKQGKISFDQVRVHLETLVEQVEECARTSTLPEDTPVELIDAIVFPYHLMQVQG